MEVSISSSVVRERRAISISHEEDIPLHPLVAIDLYGDNTALDIDFSSFTVPTEAEIKGKGKSNWLTKPLVQL